MKIIITAFVLLCLNSVLMAQRPNESYRRYWHNARLYGGTLTQNKQISTSSAAITAGNPGTTLNSEGCATISNDRGDLLFYTDGMTVFSSNNTVMDNGTGLKANQACAQPATIVPMPGNAGFYYIFTVRNWYEDSMFYSVVNMNMNAGLGKVITKNVFVQRGIKEQLAAIRKPCGSEDFWIVGHEVNSKNYVAYLLTSTGLASTPVKTSIGGYVDGTGGTNRFGCIKFAHNKFPYTRNMVSVLGGYSNTPAIRDQVTVELCDFNPLTGVVTKTLTLSTRDIDSAVYGAEFSPDNSKLYVARLPTISYQPSTAQPMVQYNLAGGTVSKLFLSTKACNIIKSAGDQLYLNLSEAAGLWVMNNPNAVGNAVNVTALPYSPITGIGTDNFYAVAGCIQDTITANIPCVNCVASFAPPRGRSYIISAWVKEQNAPATKTSYTNAQISITYVNSSGVSGPFVPKGRIIEGWQRIEETFTIPAAATDMIINLNSLSGNVFVDDIRIYPLDGSCKTYVYDPVTLRLSAELDENNYATFYEYDEEGTLVRIKKETAEGIMTIQENRSSNPKR